MCTLRNFPHLTDHCIEWARDQFELLFVKLGKSLEKYLLDPLSYELKIKDKAASEPGAAFFDIRSLTSFAKLAANPSIGNSAQLAFDIFHYLFRDRILDLQSAFPIDFRIIDSKTLEDKGAFWGEKKRYPTVMVYNPNDEAHTDFILSATCLFSVMIGLIPSKQENDQEWLKSYREKEWITNLTSSLTPPIYIQAPVNSDGIDNAPVLMDKESLHHILDNLCSELKDISTKLTNNMTFEIADFEKDDDLNFHISFITAAANLRCDNYTIKRTDFHSCKVIAGKIIAAIATTTATVCGLVMLELFKLILQKDTDSYMNRAIGLSGYMYTSFSAESPLQYNTTETIVTPDNDDLPIEAYDEKGSVKKEYMKKVISRVYPEKHTIWDKLTFSASLTLKEFSQVLSNEHGLQLKKWDFIYGYKTTLVDDDNGKNKQIQGVSASVYPTKPILNYSLLPSLDLNLPQATMSIMKTNQAKPNQLYINLWRECKLLGKIPEQPLINEDQIITENTTIKQILILMEKLAYDAEINKTIETKAISNLELRKFIIIPSSDVPWCVHIDSGDDVEHLCSFKFVL
jgi:ubiquitin-activating enzyme E1